MKKSIMLFILIFISFSAFADNLNKTDGYTAYHSYHYKIKLSELNSFAKTKFEPNEKKFNVKSIMIIYSDGETQYLNQKNINEILIAYTDGTLSFCNNCSSNNNLFMNFHQYKKENTIQNLTFYTDEKTESFGKIENKKISTITLNINDYFFQIINNKKMIKASCDLGYSFNEYCFYKEKILEIAHYKNNNFLNIIKAFGLLISSLGILLLISTLVEILKQKHPN